MMAIFTLIYFDYNISNPQELKLFKDVKGNSSSYLAQLKQKERGKAKPG